MIAFANAHLLLVDDDEDSLFDPRKLLARVKVVPRRIVEMAVMPTRIASEPRKQNGGQGVGGGVTSKQCALPDREHDSP